MGTIDLVRHQPSYEEDFNVSEIAGYILGAQRLDGGIPWNKGRHVDPWNHVEAAMGLSIGGQYEAAVQAYYWLYERQLSNGGWWARYEDSGKCSEHMETNFIAYVVTGVWHHYCITGDVDFLGCMWSMVDGALDCVLRCQHANGTVGWEIDVSGQVSRDSLLAGNASIHRSLDCGLLIAKELEHVRPKWLKARNLLANCLRQPATCFIDKSRYAMDWFYPLLSGALPRQQMVAHLEKHWSDFVMESLGCRCVSDEPWIAVAESCELVIALQAAQKTLSGKKLFKKLHRFQDTDRGYWTGYQYELSIPWPHEKTTWTMAAILLAYDALYQHTPASDIFLLPATAQ